MTRQRRTSSREVRSDGPSSEMLQPRSLVELATARLRGEILSGALDSVRLDDGSTVMGFTATASQVRGALDISATGSWRAHLAALA